VNRIDRPIPVVRIPALLLLPALCATAAGQNAAGRPDGRNVLVLYAANGIDRDRNGAADSEDVARYYARRRGVPAENLLGLKFTGHTPDRYQWPYADVVEQILKPVSKWLSAKGPDGAAPAERICYMAICPGLPTMTIPVPEPAKDEKSWFRKVRRRSVDSYLVSVDDNARIGVDPQTGFMPEAKDGGLGRRRSDLILPIYGRAFRPGPGGRHFRTLRREGKVSFYLVTRLGDSADTARDMLDGALYAERHLRLPAPDEKAAIRPAIWLDMKYKFAFDHVLAMSRAVALVQGAVKGAPFAGSEGLTRRWPLVIDTEPAQIGQGSPAHRPTVTARVAPGGVDEAGITLAAPRRLGRGAKDIPPALYFPTGCRIACYRPERPGPKTRATRAAATRPAPPAPVATATITRIDAAANRLLLDSTKGFEPGCTVKYVWGGSFPTRDCFLFYGFYGLGQFEDVRKFPPGAIGVHVDSSCMHWAKGAIRRGIGATFGVTNEPLSIGIPHGHLMLLALGSGYDWAESVYGSLRLAQRWTGVAFGDPLYAPFRSRQLRDTTPPVIGPVTVKTSGTSATVRAELAGKTDEQKADVALFRLDYGPTAKYGRVVDFQDWPEPDSGKEVKGRRFGYSRHFLWTLKGLAKGKTVHYRLTARDPAGLETRTPDATFTP